MLTLLILSVEATNSAENPASIPFPWCGDLKLFQSTLIAEAVASESDKTKFCER